MYECSTGDFAIALFLNNIANIVGSIVVGRMAVDVFGSEWLGIFSGVLTFAVIIFAEIIPKTVGERYSVKVALLMSKPVLFLTKLVMPVIWLVEFLTSPFTKGQQQLLSTDEKEIRFMAQLGEEEGVIEADELEMLHGVFQLNDRSASDLMTPRVSLTCIEGALLIKHVIDEVITSQHSRIVVIGDSRDEIVGVVLRSDGLVAMVNGQGDDTGRMHGYTPIEVNENQKADDILPIFQKSRQHLAIVRDDFGGVAGVITLEDIIEELTGEIVDERDTVEDMREFEA